MITWYGERPTEDQSLTIAFLTEGTYPFSGGGVSTWCDLLLSGLPTVNFHIIATTSQPHRKPRYALPPNVQCLTQIPLWGASSTDSTQRHTGLYGLARARLRTSEHVISQAFVPAFRRWLRFLYGEKSQGDCEDCGAAIVTMARFLRNHDYATTFRSRAVWSAYADAITEWYRPAPTLAGFQPQPTLSDIAVTLEWLSAMLRPLAVSPPKADLYHATIASSVGLLGIVAHLEQQVPFLLTEHGVFLRERAISSSIDGEHSFFQKHFLVSIADATTRLCYRYADLVTPVCSFNGRWEVELGAERERVRVIYNAIDTTRFTPHPKPAEVADRPTVITVANVTPFKDIITLIRAAALVRAQVRDVRFLVYGSLTADPAYADLCRERIQAMALDTTVYLAGHHSQPELIYPQGDLTVLPSVSEAFPFTVLESMACGRPVVATNVGGIAEAIGETGLLVPPRLPAELANAILLLLQNPDRCHALGEESRERAVKVFQIQHLLAAYAEVYRKLASQQTSRTRGSLAGWAA